MPASRPYLLFVRAGGQSLHGRLIAEDPARNWDCCVSWYVPPRAESLAEYYSGGGFNKFEGFVEFWRSAADLRRYRYILKRRGVFTSTVERAPSPLTALSAGEKREITTLLKAIEGDVESYPFGPE